MLETKRVVAYGKRSTRIVYVSNDNHVSHNTPNQPKGRVGRENPAAISPATTRKAISRGRKVHGLSTSPRGSPKSGNIFGLSSKKPSDHSVGITPKRRPFGPKYVVPASPSIVYLGRKSTQTPDAKQATFAPFVDSDIAVTHGPYRTAREDFNEVHKGRTPWSAHAVNDAEPEVTRPSRRRAVKRPIIISDDEDEDDGFTVKQARRGNMVNPIVISGDESEDYPQIVHPIPAGDDMAPVTGIQSDTVLEHTQFLPTEDSRCPQGEVSLPALSTPLRQTRGEDVPLPITIIPQSARSPRRSRRNHRNRPRLAFENHHKPALDLGDSFAALSIAADIPVHLRLPQALPGPSLKTPVLAPLHLVPLLKECGQTMPRCFSTFIQAFPLDDVHAGNASDDLVFRKIGEASYSEVYAIGNVVLKIIPLRDDSCAAQPFDGDLDMPQESDARDVLQEVIVTRVMGQTCPGFIKLLRTYVVVGEYPASLLSLWDKFNDMKTSENVRPNAFPSTQAYALLVLPNGGPDLEAYNFPMRTGWRQACSIFWQIAKALATAEELVSFEHRDLHWGQILVKGATPVRKKAARTPRHAAAVNIRDANGVGSIPMDHPSHGVTATIIDLGLARINGDDSNNGSVHWTRFDDLTFEGEGDYQFNVYRMMRHVLGRGSWDQYCPLTNVMWLHYLLLKLLRFKRLRPPGPRTTVSITDGFNEKQCYNCLIETEQLLANCIPQLKGKKYRGAMKGNFSKAGDVVHFAKGRGWVELH